MDQNQGGLIPDARVLVVEDEEITRRAITRALGLTGYETEGVAGGEQALARLATSSYDLMLLDLHMPGLDGVEVMRRVAALYPDLLVIVFTAHATVDSAIEAVRAGAVDYLLKPTSIRDVQAAISRALEQRREKMRRRHLIRVMADALAALQAEEAHEQRRAGSRRGRFFHAGPVSLDLEKRLVVVSGADGRRSFDAELTENEAALLGCLMENEGTPLSCRALAATALGYDVTEAAARDIVRPHISRLRKKLEIDPARPALVRTVRGQGYLFAPHG
jgi:DNA-binding response OmpR family regulator